jgi:hypothetical protein
VCDERLAGDGKRRMNDITILAIIELMANKLDEAGLDLQTALGTTNALMKLTAGRQFCPPH